MQFMKLNLGCHTDERRAIIDFCLPEGFELPFTLRQTKVVKLTQKAVESGLAVGNHYHTNESGRQEFFVAVGEPGVPLFKVSWREARKEVPFVDLMYAGDACHIPTGVSHAFVGLRPGVELWGFSNLPYDSAHDVPDKLL